MVAEIYPRALTGPVNKSSHDERLQYLTRTFPNLSRRQIAAAAACEDAFDAAVAALMMQRRIDELRNLAKAADPVTFSKKNLVLNHRSRA
jgi:predicted nuclease with RNAse H fold